MSAPLTPAQARKKHQPTFNRFYMAYPRKTHINEAANVWARLMEAGEDPVRIVRAAEGFAATNPELKYVPGPHRWLENGRYDDTSLFEDEKAAAKAWLKQMWREANVKAVEGKFHISMPKRYPPDDITNPDAIRFWHKQAVRDWITEVYKEKVECQPTSSPTTNEQSSRSSVQSCTTPEYSLI